MRNAVTPVDVWLLKSQYAIAIFEEFLEEIEFELQRTLGTLIPFLEQGQQQFCIGAVKDPYLKIGSYREDISSLKTGIEGS